jgi:methyl-accepting chemotaxis protein
LSFIKELLTNFEIIKQLATDALQEVSDQKQIKDSMTDMTKTVIEQAENIDFLMTDQKDSIDNVVISIENTNRIVQNNAENTEKLRDQSKSLQDMSDNLKSHFKNDD